MIYTDIFHYCFPVGGTFRMNTAIRMHPSDADLKMAAEILSKGGLVAFPTETVYGLGGNALLPDAAKKIYAAKGRPSDNPLIIHLSSPEEAEKYAVTCSLFYKLAMAFMPGPLTVILKKKDCIPFEVTGGLNTVAIRVPSDETAHKLLSFCSFPIAAPSANLSGKPSPTAVEHVIDDLNGKIDVILNGGACTVGLESTIVSIEGDDLSLLRPGAVTPEMLAPFCAHLTLDAALERPLRDGEHPLAPGMKYKHYAPNASVILLHGNREDIFAFLAEKKNDPSVGILFDDEMLKRLDGVCCISLGSTPDEEAAKLFSALRAFDKLSEVQTIYAPLPSKAGIGLAVYNRLIKAAGFTVQKI